MSTLRRFTCLLLLSVLSTACDRRQASMRGALEFSGPPGSGQPNLTAAGDGSVLLTWLEPSSADRFALRVSIYREGRWSPPRTIRESDSFFVNWADFPSIVELPSGEWAVHWLQKVPGHAYAYHVNLAFSRDRGATWSEPVVPHRDASPTEHGFVSMLPWPGGGLGLVWLDGRAMATVETEEGEMGVRFTTLHPTGSRGEDVLLDGRTCECCQTALARTHAGFVVAYRDRSLEEIRDISVVRYRQGKWGEPVLVADDRWRYPGCPVNGPALAAGRVEGAQPTEDALAIAWYTEGPGRPTVFVAFSEDDGGSFGRPIRVDDGDALGRVDLELLADGSAVVVWIEAAAGEGSVRARRVGRDGRSGRSRALARVSAARTSGFPRIATLAGDSILFAWTETGAVGGIRVGAASVGW